MAPPSCDRFSILVLNDKDHVLPRCELLSARRRTHQMLRSACGDYREVAEDLAAISPPLQKVVVAVLLDFCCFDKCGGMNFCFLGLWLCELNPEYKDAFESCFIDKCWRIQDSTIDVETVKKLASFFAKLFNAGVLPWRIVAHVCLKKEDMSPTFCIFVKAFFNAVAYPDCLRLTKALMDTSIHKSIESVFPEKGPRDPMFFVNYFEALGDFNWIPHTLRFRLENMKMKVVE